MKALVIAEHDNHQLSSATRSVISAAMQLSTSIDVLVAGHACQSVVEEVARLQSVARVLVNDAPEYRDQLAENVAALIASLAPRYQYILAAASTAGKNVLPRVSGLLNVAMVSDVIAIQDPHTFVRPIYAGNALMTVRASEKIQLLTVRTTAFPKVELTTTASPIEQIDLCIANTFSKRIKEERHISPRPELTTARIVISGGRGLKSAENFKLLETLADQLGDAAVGASRAAVDAGFVPNDLQVGQTGKMVAPDLYIAVGISGAIQHVAGMKDSKVIVAINNDPQAAIFSIADYGLVGDLFVILPALCKELSIKE